MLRCVCVCVCRVDLLHTSIFVHLKGLCSPSKVFWLLLLLFFNPPKPSRGNCNSVIPPASGVRLSLYTIVIYAVALESGSATFQSWRRRDNVESKRIDFHWVPTISLNAMRLTISGVGSKRTIASRLLAGCRYCMFNRYSRSELHLVDAGNLKTWSRYESCVSTCWGDGAFQAKPSGSNTPLYRASFDQYFDTLGEFKNNSPKQ